MQASDSLELESIVSHPTSVLGTELGSSTRTICAFSPSAISSASGHAISPGKYQGCLRLTSYFLSSSPFLAPPFPPLLPPLCSSFAPVPSISAHNLGLFFSTSTRKINIVNYPTIPRDLLVHIHVIAIQWKLPSNMSRALSGTIGAVCQGSQGPRK